MIRTKKAALEADNKRLKEQEQRACACAQPSLESGTSNRVVDSKNDRIYELRKELARMEARADWLESILERTVNRLLDITTSMDGEGVYVIPKEIMAEALLSIGLSAHDDLKSVREKHGELS